MPRRPRPRKWPTETHRFLAKVLVGDGCWEWTANRDSKGYGRFWVGSLGRKVLAHRYCYELLRGPIPEGLDLDHLCRNPRCVRPDHLEPVTHQENMLRGKTNVAAVNAAKTHCPAGHPYDADNTLHTENGWRRCRTCHREREHARYHSKRQVVGADL